MPVYTGRITLCIIYNEEVMKTISELKTKIESDSRDTIQSVFIAMCNGVHPLMEFVPDFYKEEYKTEVVELTEKNIIKAMEDYIDFAFEKANDQRGLSAERSIWKFKQWLWALEDTEIINFDYDDYGIAIITRIANKYNLKRAAQP